MFICQEKIADTENYVKILFWQMGIDTSQMKQLFLYSSAAWVLPKGICSVPSQIRRNPMKMSTLRFGPC